MPSASKHRPVINKRLAAFASDYPGSENRQTNSKPENSWIKDHRLPPLDLGNDEPAAAAQAKPASQGQTTVNVKERALRFDALALGVQLSATKFKMKQRAFERERRRLTGGLQSPRSQAEDQARTDLAELQEQHAQQLHQVHSLNLGLEAEVAKFRDEVKGLTARAELLGEATADQQATIELQVARITELTASLSESACKVRAAEQTLGELDLQLAQARAEFGLALAQAQLERESQARELDSRQTALVHAREETAEQQRQAEMFRDQLVQVLGSYDELVRMQAENDVNLRRWKTAFHAREKELAAQAESERQNAKQGPLRRALNTVLGRKRASQLPDAAQDDRQQPRKHLSMQDADVDPSPALKYAEELSRTVKESLANHTQISASALGASLAMSMEASIMEAD
jgi:DNA repair exonuclease SbcCD ATPase subunit